MKYLDVVDKPSRPVLRYHGGKWKLAPWIVAQFPPHRIYVEPFMGAASVLMRKPVSYAEVINDLDDEIVNIFKVLRDEPGRLFTALKRTPFARSEYAAAFERCSDPVEMARRTIIRSHMGFGSNAINRKVQSGFRSNSKRSGTTPAHDWSNVSRQVIRFTKRLSGVVIENCDALKLIPTHDTADTLFYCDPPYVHSTRNPNVRGNAKGYHHEMTDADHEALAACLHSVLGMVVLSGYESPLYERLYPDWARLKRSALGDGACKRTELLWFNPPAWDRRVHGLFHQQTA